MPFGSWLVILRFRYLINTNSVGLISLLCCCFSYFMIVDLFSVGVVCYFVADVSVLLIGCIGLFTVVSLV